ncbi:MAG: menH, partial [Acidimicrobiales bacterium]|nr:menH [Acidimicrobiales bacterium]
ARPGNPDPLVAGTAVRIMTGAIVPDGADAVVPVEDTTSDGGHVTIIRGRRAGEYVRDRGSDLRAGAELLGRAGSGATGPGDPGTPAVYVGYSMGGRLALRLALDRSDLVAGLILLGATAGIDDAAERAARRTADEALADRIEHDGVEAFLRGWLAQPLLADPTPAADDLAARRANSPTGLASSLRRAGTGTMDPPWWDELPACTVPTLVVAGELDAKFTALGRRLAATLGDGRTARFATVEAAGHAAHLRSPTTFAALVRAFVTTLPAPPPA